MDLEAARDASTRLEPLRRLLADVKLVVDSAIQTKQDQEEAATAAAALRSEIEDLRTHLADLDNRKHRALQTYELEAVQYAKLAAKGTADFHARKAAMDADLAAYTAQLSAEQATVLSAYSARIAAAKAETDKAEQDLAATQSALEVLQARVRGI